jgi:hypothetical protein
VGVGNRETLSLLHGRGGDVETLLPNISAHAGGFGDVRVNVMVHCDSDELH